MTLEWRHTKSNWFWSWSQLAIQCVFACLCGPVIDIQKNTYKKIIFSDEAYFDFGGYINKQICRIWGTENPHAYIGKLMQPKWVTVWCRFSSRGIVGPFFFENEQGVTVTVNGDRYRAMLKRFLFTKIEDEDIGNICFNSTALRATKPKLYSMFYALFLKIALSAAKLSCDLTQLDYYL